MATYCVLALCLFITKTLVKVEKLMTDRCKKNAQIKSKGQYKDK